MGLDLTLTAIPGEMSFLIQQAKANVHYAQSFDKITDAETLRQHLSMIRSVPDGTVPSVLETLIADALMLAEWHKKNSIEPIQFHSYTRGYDTLNYLLVAHFKQAYSEKMDSRKEYKNVLYQGQDIFQNRDENWHIRFQYWTDEQTKEFAHLLELVEFEDLLRYYDYEKMKDEVYKLTRPEQLSFLREEYYTLKAFYKKATQINGYILIRVD